MLVGDKGNSGALRGIPLISVVIPSYNHAKYISKALESVFAQDFSDFELLISDDASTDNSWEVISGFSDSRMRAFRQSQNLGPVGNLVFLIKEARGKYVALLNSDDVWYPGKLSKQFHVMNSLPNLGACFTWADLVDVHGREISGTEAIWNDVFRQSNRTQGQWLRHFFFKGNCLCHPSILARREIYETVGFYNPGLKQLPDFEMWIRLVKHYPIHVIQENLVAHMRDGNNTSAVSPENSARNLTELVEIFGAFFDRIPEEIFIEGFAADFRSKHAPVSSTRLLCEKLFLLLDSSFALASSRAAALSLFIKHFSDPEFEQVLQDEYRFSIFDFYRLTGTSGLGHFHMLAVNNPMHGRGKGEGCLPVAAGRAFRYLKRMVLRACQAFKWHGNA